MATNALSHLVEAASALADMPAPAQKSGLAAPQSGAFVLEEDTQRAREAGLPVVPRNKREIFPERLLAILNESSLSDIITWLPHGRSFVIIRPDVFAEKIMPTYFPSPDARTSTKYPSFTRKLNRWGFRQATRGPDTGAFHHPLFRRDQPQLCLDMVCQRSRSGSKQSRAKQAAAAAAAAAAVAQGNLKIAPLTKKSLDTILPHTGAPQQAHHQGSARVATVSVTDETVSNSSNIEGGSSSSNSSSTGVAILPSVKQGISSDKAFVQKVLKDHGEMERLRIAKVMLYRAYVEALQGAQVEQR